MSQESTFAGTEATSSPQHASGGVYRWVENCGPDQIEPPILPAPWLDWLRSAGCCREAEKQRSRGSVFLSSHIAARLLTEALEKNTKSMTCHRILASLVEDGVLRLHKKGNSRLASRYFFIWQPENEIRRDEPPTWLTGS